jgi:hypothetical protein
MKDHREQRAAKQHRANPEQGRTRYETVSQFEQQQWSRDALHNIEGF